MKNFILFIMCVLFAQCNILWECDDVLPKAVPFTGNQLKINGYYYESISNNKAFSPMILYGNGVTIKIDDVAYNIEEMDEYIRKKYVNGSRYKKNKYIWGVFFVEDRSIRVHRLIEDYPHRENIWEGIILNDTTFQFTKYTSGNNVSERNEIYHYREFSPKPDSTNKYIK